MFDSPEAVPPVGSPEGETAPSSPAWTGATRARKLDVPVRDLVPGDQSPRAGSVELRSGAWRWTLIEPEDGDTLEGCTLRLVDPSDPRRRMDVPGLPRVGVDGDEVAYFARRAETRWVPCGPGEYQIRTLRLRTEMGTPFGTRVGVRIRVLTPSGSWREGSLSPGVRIGDLTDDELRHLADRARAVPAARFND